MTTHIDGITISYEPNFFSLSSSYCPKEQKEFASLIEEAQVSPKKAYKKALQWKKRSPELDNLLTYLHIHNKKIGLAEKLIVDSFNTYPNYFFAKLNYADQCLRKKDLSRFRTVFSSFSLQELFPEKISFHVCEFRGFATLISNYYLAINNKTLALAFYKKALAVDPLHPSVSLLEKKLCKKRVFTCNPFTLLKRLPIFN